MCIKSSSIKGRACPAIAGGWGWVKNFYAASSSGYSFWGYIILYSGTNYFFLRFTLIAHPYETGVEIFRSRTSGHRGSSFVF